MPPLQLTNLLHRTLPNLSPNGRAILSALACMNGRPASLAELAAWLGFHDRYQLARALRREGLPPMETLGGWTRTLYWIIQSQSTGVTLRELARREDLDPAVAYRLVRRVTGRRWSELCAEGLAAALLSFRDHCRSRAGIAPARHRIADQARSPRPVRSSLTLLPAKSEARPPSRLRGILDKRVSISGAPFDIALTATNVALVTRHHAAALDVLELSPPRVAQTISVGPVPSRVVPNAQGDLAYVTGQFAEAIDIVDVQRGEQIAEVPVAGHPLGAVLSRDGRFLYVATNCDRLVALSLARRAVVGDVAIPLGSLQLCRDPSGHRLYASGFRTGLVTEIQVPALRLLRTFDVGGIVQEVAVSPDGETLYVANEAGWLDVIHLATGARTARVDLGSAAMGLTISADHADVVVGLLFAGEVVIMDRQTLEIRATLQTGGRPRLMTAHPKGAVLVANEAGWVDVIR